MQKQAEIFNRSVVDQEIWNFYVNSDGIYLISILARCKNWRQNARRLFNDDDLGIWLDNYPFAELSGKKREFAGIGSWNGNKLANKDKAVIFVLPLAAGQHHLRFWVDGSPFLQLIEVYQPGLGEQEIELPFLPGVAVADIIFKNVPLDALSIVRGNDITQNFDVASGGLGVRAWELQRFGQSPLVSIRIKLGQKAIKYKIGRIKLYQGIALSTEVNLRAEPNEEALILARLVNGEELEIIAERVAGGYVSDRSSIWHEVLWQGKRGFILSSFVEIEGQEQGRVIELIKAKCREYKIDANIMLAIAEQESHFKPYAISKRGAQGIFQLLTGTAADMGVADRLDFYQNIDGGARYYKWIEGKIIGRGNVLEKRLVAWHSGTGRVPKKGPVDYDRLPHGAEARQFVKDVLEKLSRKNWRGVTSAFLLMTIGLLGFFGGQATRQATGAERNYSKALNSAFVSVPITGNRGLVLGAQAASPGPAEHSPRLVWNKKLDDMTLFNSQGRFVKNFPVKRLNIDAILETPADIMSWRSVSVDDIIEAPENTFYFTVATSWSCGANNCGQVVLYKYDLTKDSFIVVNKNLFGGVALYPSPDVKKLAVVSHVSGGFCNTGAYLTIIDLDNFKKEDIDKFKKKTDGYSSIVRLSWKNNEEIELAAYGRECRNLAFPGFYRDFVYNLKTKRIKLISQRVAPES